jgi:hypothetical protein
MERLVGTYIFDPELTAGKMIFLSGPRQVGKTTFARAWLKSAGSEETYFNWDDPSVMLAYTRNPLHFHNVIDEEFKGKRVPLVFDELHKHRGWRNLLKGLFDAQGERIALLVTGSARLGFMQKSGDSLLGRYFSFQMFPLGLPEVIADFSSLLSDERPLADGKKLAALARDAGRRDTGEGLALLMRFGGFPEPLVRGSERFHRRWQTEYKRLLTKEEVRDISRISDLRGLETLVELLPTKVGSPLSITSLSSDLNRKYDTVKNWIDMLEALYMVFTLRPWHRSISRAIKKEKKLYFSDWSLLPDSGRRFENLIAVALCRMAARLTESGLGRFEVCYIRDREKREVDFVLVKDKAPLALFEAKTGDSSAGAGARYFSNKLSIPLYQIVLRSERVEAFPGNCFLIPAANFLLLTG